MTAVADYIAGLDRAHRRGDATEHSYSGNGLVEKPRYEPPVQDSAHPSTGSGRAKSGRVWINKTQYFDDIDPDTWSFHVGGYQVLEKWLKDRKGRTLGIDDIVHYRRVAALRRTRELMRQVDECATPLWTPEPEGATA